jgi:hypothetical protein
MANKHLCPWCGAEIPTGQKVPAATIESIKKLLASFKTPADATGEEEDMHIGKNPELRRVIRQ